MNIQKYRGPNSILLMFQCVIIINPYNKTYMYKSEFIIKNK